MSRAPATAERRGPAPRGDAAAGVRGPSILPLRLAGVSYEAGGKRLIDDISLDLAAGPRSVVLGPNGAGKSLLLRLCHGLIGPSAGRISWAGPAGPEVRRRQAMVFQQPVLLRRSVALNVAYPLRLRGVPGRERRARVEEALAKAGLAALAGQPARTLSGGEQQRLAIARAWAPRPDVLFLDEPTSNLDPAATRAVEDLILTVHASGTKIVMTTHDLGQARRLADEILFLHRGRLLERTAAQRFFTAPRTAEAAAFIKGDLIW
ncbi:MAG: phosphate ABC transporter ATP-binding protein [Kiloniellaceae bacterium]